MKSSLIILGLLGFVWYYVETHAIEIQTSDPTVNNWLKLPKQIPLHEIIFNTQKDNQSAFLQVYLSPNDPTLYLNK